MSNDLDNNSNGHFGAVLLAIAALSTLSVLAAGKIGEARQSPIRAALADVEWQVSLDQRF